MSNGDSTLFVNIPSTPPGTTPWVDWPVSLFRTNYFNGRVLTAETLQREQEYWDSRCRLIAQAQGGGVASGFFVTQPDAANPDTMELGAGLAFDDGGLPIYSDSPLRFSFAERVNAITTPGTPPDPCAWVLRIAAVEQDSPDTVSVYGGPCADSSKPDCQPRGRQGGIQVLPPTPLAAGLAPDANAARSELAAYYFDEEENKLASRWQAGGAGALSGPPFVAPGRASGVAVALVWVVGGKVQFVDPWIVRRPLVASAAASWVDAAAGAPTPAAVAARHFQFQSQLAQSPTPTTPQNLYDRGFRRLPPFGWLPVAPLTPDPSSLSGSAADIALAEARWIRQARDGASSYFKGTNVAITRYQVALHDDDLYDAAAEAARADPITLAQVSDPRGDLLDGFNPLDPPGERPWPSGSGRDLLARVVLEKKIKIERIVNHEIELVRIVIPLLGRKRAYSALPPAPSVTGLDFRPRDFVLFVRERIDVSPWTMLALQALELDTVTAANLWAAYAAALKQTSDPTTALQGIRAQAPAAIDFLLKLAATNELGKQIDLVLREVGALAAA
jgi:hypothetical protein